MLYKQSLPQSDKEINFPPLPDFCCLAPDFDSKDALFRLLAHLHRSGKHAYYWLASEAKHPASHKRAGDALEMLTVWFPAGEPAPIPSDVGQSGPLHIYFGVHPSSVVRPSPRRATNSTIDVVNCLYAEIDLKDHGADWQQVWSVVQAAHVPPSVILFSGGGLHLYWLLQRPYHLTIDIVDLAREDYQHIVAHSDGTKAIRKQNQERFAHIQGVQRRWVESQYDQERKIGMDQNAKDMTRVLRLPGTINYKGKYAPHFPTVTFLKADFDLTYSLAELESYVPAPSQKPSTEPAARSNKLNTPRIAHSEIRTDQLGRKPGCVYPEFESQQDKAAFFLNRLDPSCSRAEWIRIGMTLTELNNAGLDLWDRWSSDSDKYKEGEPARIWESFKRSGVGLGTLIKIAQDANPLPNAPTWNDLYPNRPLGGRQHYYQPTHEELELQAKMMGQRSPRKGQPIGAPGGVAEARHTYHYLDVQAIGEEIVSLFCPSKTNYGFLNPPGVKSKDGRDEPIIKASSKRDGELTPDAIRLAFNHGKRRIKVDGKRKRVHTSIMANPIDDDGMTRVLAIGTTPEGVKPIMECLNKLSLSSIAIQVGPLPKVDRFPTTPIPYIYKESHSGTLPEMGVGQDLHTFGSEELEKQSDQKSDTLPEMGVGDERSTFGSEELEKQSDKKGDTLPEMGVGDERSTFGSEELEKQSDKKGDTL
ncbi:MAG: PriCT-2 domain-containing protein, partial [Ardenticatenaceae bacterium]